MEHAQLSWRDGQPFSKHFEDVYFSRDQGLEETEHVFLAANGLPAAWRQCSQFVIGETGFGSGLNFVVTAAHWLRHAPADARLYYFSVEKFPFTADDLGKALSLYPQLQHVVDELIAVYPPAVRALHPCYLFGGRIVLMLMFDDAVQALQRIEQRMDAWFLDGFSPDKNPAMWSDALFAEIARLSHAGTTLSTYTAAGFVRRGLAAQGFDMRKHSGFGNKREMLCGLMPQRVQQVEMQPWFQPSQWQPREREAVIIGAGIAGVTTAHALARRGWRVRILDQHGQPAAAASGNPLGVVMPRLAVRASTETDFHYAAFCVAARRLRALKKNIPELEWHASGVVQLVSSPRVENQLRNGRFDAALARVVDADELSALCGLQLNTEALWLPLAGYVQPAQLCRLLLQDVASQVEFIGQTTVHDFEHDGEGWILYDAQRQPMMRSETLVVANGHQLGEFAATRWLAPTPVRGQISELAATTHSAELRCPLCYDGYVLPARHGRHVVGASFHMGGRDTELSEADHRHNDEALQHTLPNIFEHPSPGQGRAAVRAATADRLPLTGAVPDVHHYLHTYAELARGRPGHSYGAGRYLPGLYVNVGHGSRGLSSAWLSSELLAAEIDGEPSPVYNHVRCALHAARFLIRALKKGQAVSL